ELESSLPVRLLRDLRSGRITRLQGHLRLREGTAAGIEDDAREPDAPGFHGPHHPARSSEPMQHVDVESVRAGLVRAVVEKRIGVRTLWRGGEKFISRRIYRLSQIFRTSHLSPGDRGAEEII